jgi:hypothetical protein
MRPTRSLALTAALVLTSALSAFAQAARIDTISPGMARPGDQVTITGNGFAGQNVRITVGAIPARVVSAVGTSATFVVPDGALIGLTTVTATNSGGRSGSIAFRVLLGLTVDPAWATQALIGADGGTVQTTRGGATFKLTIPPGALDGDTTITLTPVVSIANLPFSGGVVAAGQFGPNGLTLHRDAQLSITLPAAVPVTGLLGFLIDDEGLNLEVLPGDANGTTLTVSVGHFTTAGGAVGTLQDFEQQVLPLLNALPPSLPPSQVASLAALVAAWIDRFGFAVCTDTNLCHRAFEIATQSLASAQTQACTVAQTFINDGEPFLAHDALRDVVHIASNLVEISDLAAQAQEPGFDLTLNLACIGSSIHAIVDLAASQALANPSAGVLGLLLDLAGDAQLLALDDESAHALNTLASVVLTLLGKAGLTCAADPDAGEILIDLILATFDDNTLNALDDGLADRFHEVRAGCRVRLSPALPNVALQQTVQFTGFVVGLSPSTVTWSLASASLGTTIDSQTGLFTAGQTIGTVVVQATSVADPTRFRQTTVTVIGNCPGGPQPEALEDGPHSGPFAADDIPPVCIAVDPPSATATTGHEQQFTATVTGGTNQQIVWSVTGDSTITVDGLVTAGVTAGTFTVRAASVVDPTVFGEATLTIPRSIIVVPTNGIVTKGHPLSFGAQVSGAGPLVAWTATGGSIPPGPSATATYTAGTTAGTFAVTATSVDDPSLSRTVAVTVTGDNVFTFDDGSLEGWDPSCALSFVCHPNGAATFGRISVIQLGDSPGKVVVLDGTLLTGTWISKSFNLAANVATLEFDLGAHNKDGADARFVVRIVDANGSTTLLDQVVTGTPTDSARVLNPRTLSLAGWGGRSVRIFFEQHDNGAVNPDTGLLEFPGRGEQIYLDNVRIR